MKTSKGFVLFGLFALAAASARAEWGHGLRYECKDPSVANVQQGGWDCEEDAAPVAARPVVAQEKPRPQAAAAPAPVEAQPQDEPQFQKSDGGLKLTFASELFFATNSSSLGSAARGEIGKLVRWLKKNPNTTVRIEGHTDNAGAPAYNKDLSQKRAQAVADAVVSEGIASSRVKAVGYGETRPVASNETKDGRQANRRVEAFIPS